MDKLETLEYFCIFFMVKSHGDDSGSLSTHFSEIAKQLVAPVA